MHYIRKILKIGKLINYMVSNPQKFGCAIGH
jgi:hypothetical protein